VIQDFAVFIFGYVLYGARSTCYALLAATDPVGLVPHVYRNLQTFNLLFRLLFAHFEDLLPTGEES
jgi:hypothetical protein